MSLRKGIGMTSERTRRRLTERLEEAGISSPRVLDAILSVPRHLFVDEALSHRAYEDTALPIGHNQTISQPYIVALMTQFLLEVAPKRVLEVGTGSGYQTAILAFLNLRVFTVERVAGLAERARGRLKQLGVRGVRFHHADGSIGWASEEPFDGVIVTAGAREIPSALKEHLAVGGRMVIPVGNTDNQALTLVDRDQNGWHETIKENVRFVPLMPGLEI